MEIVNNEPSKQEIRLAEYKAAQSSAEHHDRLVWTVTSILLSGSFVVMGIILKSPMKGLSSFVSLLLCILGFILTLFVWSAQNHFRNLKNHSYDRCKEIEKELGMSLHSDPKLPAGSQTFKYRFIMALFLLAWFFIALSVIWNFFKNNL